MSNSKLSMSLRFLAGILISAFPFSLWPEKPMCKVVLSYKCMVNPLYGTKEMERLALGYRKLVKGKQMPFTTEYDVKKVESIIYPDRIYVVDLNRDQMPEYIVPVQCGATGNCLYYIFADHPARYIGEIYAQYIIFEPLAGEWPVITTFCNLGAMEGDITVYKFKNWKYEKESSLTVVDGIDKNGKQIDTLSPFLKEMGDEHCECRDES